MLCQNKNKISLQSKSNDKERSCFLLNLQWETKLKHLYKWVFWYPFCEEYYLLQWWRRTKLASVKSSFFKTACSLHTWFCACVVGCLYLQKFGPLILPKRYVIPMYEKTYFPEYQSFPTSSSFGKSKLKIALTPLKVRREKSFRL